MNSAEHIAQSPPDGPALDPPGATASVKDLAHSTSEYVHAWSTLVASETRLAHVSAIRLAFAALVVPAIALGICTTLDAFIAVLLQRWLHDWASCIAITLFLDLAGLCVLLVGMRRWWRNLSLPRSRGALVQLLERLA
jgi:hypothetical protein